MTETEAEVGNQAGDSIKEKPSMSPTVTRYSLEETITTQGYRIVWWATKLFDGHRPNTILLIGLLENIAVWEISVDSADGKMLNSRELGKGSVTHAY